MQDKRNGKRILAVVLGISIGVIGGQWTGAAAQDSKQADIEKGKETAGQACVQCHNMRTIQQQRKSLEKWRDTVYGMISQGAPVFPDEIEPLAAYLAANYGPNSPRSASPAQAAGGAQPAQGGVVQQLPDGEGKTILASNCQECHGLDMVTAKAGSSQDDWTTIVARMLTYGAKLTPPDQKTLVKYLSGLPQRQKKSE